MNLVNNKYIYIVNSINQLHLRSLQFIINYRGKSPITDPLSYLSKYKSYQKIIYT